MQQTCIFITSTATFIVQRVPRTTAEPDEVQQQIATPEDDPVPAEHEALRRTFLGKIPHRLCRSHARCNRYADLQRGLACCPDCPCGRSEGRNQRQSLIVNHICETVGMAWKLASVQPDQMLQHQREGKADSRVDHTMLHQQDLSPQTPDNAPEPMQYFDDDWCTAVNQEDI